MTQAADFPLPADLAGYLKGTWCEVLGMELVQVTHGCVKGQVNVRPQLLAPNGYLHAGVVVSLADSCCGFGSMASLPEGAQGFTTIELKSNHLGTARDGTLECLAQLAHGGRTTQVWDATVTHRESGKTMALFRCTQMVLYPKT